MLKNRTIEELKELAVDLHEKQIFTDKHLSNSDEVGMVFMPIALGACSNMSEEEIKDIGLVYEYYSKASPRSINGLPIFLSMKIINKKDAKFVFKLLKELEKNKEELLKNF